MTLHNWFNNLVCMNEIELVGAFEAKTHLSALLERVATGESFRITKRGRPVADLRPIDDADTRLTFGEDKGKIELSPDFDAPLPDMEEYA